MKNIQRKREREKQMVGLMIRLYCKRKHHPEQDLCPQCRELYDYACRRCDLCPFMETKTFCSNCKVHCYQPEMRRKIQEVMGFSGPHMLLYHPGLALAHLWTQLRERKQGGNQPCL